MSFTIFGPLGTNSFALTGSINDEEVASSGFSIYNISFGCFRLFFADLYFFFGALASFLEFKFSFYSTLSDFSSDSKVGLKT